MSQQYKAVAAILQQAITSVNAILNSPDDELHRLSVTNDLERSHNKLLLLTGTGDLEAQQSVVLGPAKTIGGQPIKKLRTFTEADLVPSDDKVFKLKQDIEDALVYFGEDLNNGSILANIPDMIIRGVAKRAGLKVTKDQPKELTLEFIDDVKAALRDAGLIQRREPAPALTEEELQALAKKHTPLFLTDKPEGTIEAPETGSGGVSEIHILNTDDVGASPGTGKVLFEEAKAATQEQLDKGIEDAIMGPDPSAPVGDGLATEANLKRIKEELKSAEQKAIPEQETKPDTKKKAGK